MSTSDPPTQVMRRDSLSMSQGEQRVVRVHQHWVVLLRAIALRIIVTLILLVAFLYVLGQQDPSQVGLAAVFLALLPAALALLIVLTILWTLYAVWDWYSDYMELTNRRLIVRVDKPLIRSSRQEIPLGKIQTVSSLFPDPLHKQLNYGRIEIDTSGLGKVVFADVGQPLELRAMILDTQKALQAVAAPRREAYRQDMVRHILYGTPAPPAPGRSENMGVQTPVGYSLFNQLFPFRPQRMGTSVIWHKHWWFLLRAELVPVAIVVIFEILSLLTTVLFNVMGAESNPAAPVLAFIRPFIWLLALPVALWQWEDWRNDYYEVREDRLIDRDALPLGLYDETKETELRRITDIRTQQRNPLSKFLRYGDIVAKTPGESTQFTFEGVPNPNTVLSEIMDRIDLLREREAAQQSREMQEWLRSYTGEIQNYQRWIAEGAPPGPQPPLPPRV